MAELTKAVAGKTTKVEIAGTTIREVIEITALNQTYSIYDVTYHKEEWYRDTIPGLFDIIEFTIEANYSSSEIAALQADLSARAQEDITITYPLWDVETTASKHSFKGYVSGLTVNPPLDAQVTYTVTITVTGEVTFTQGS